jgi:hypothetical protein
MASGGSKIQILNLVDDEASLLSLYYYCLWSKLQMLLFLSFLCQGQWWQQDLIINLVTMRQVFCHCTTTASGQNSGCSFFYNFLCQGHVMAGLKCSTLDNRASITASGQNSRCSFFCHIISLCQQQELDSNL